MIDNDHILKLVELFLEQERLDIIASQTTKNLKASGDSAASLRTVQTANGGQLVDESGSFEYQEFGRGPGKAPSFDVIYEWLKYKKYGLNYEHLTTGEGLRGITTDTKRRQLAWAIVQKIKKKGTYTHIRNKPTGVLTDSINDQNLLQLQDNIADKYSTEILSDIQGIIK